MPHPPITLRLPGLAFLGRDVVGKTLHRSLFLSSTSGAPQKNNLVLVTGLVFLFFPLPHPPITLRLLRLAFLGRDVVGKTLHRSLFLSSTSGAPQKPTFNSDRDTLPFAAAVPVKNIDGEISGSFSTGSEMKIYYAFRCFCQIPRIFSK